jgi:hypothetical protein
MTSVNKEAYWNEKELQSSRLVHHVDNSSTIFLSGNACASLTRISLCIPTSVPPKANFLR